MRVPQYHIQLHPKAENALQNADPCYQSQLKETLEAVSQERQPTDHPKVEILQNNHSKKLYKIRVGEYRCICELDKPNLLVLKIAKRPEAYDDINELYANL